MPWGSVRSFWNPKTEAYEELDPVHFQKRKKNPYRPRPRKPYEMPTIFDKQPRQSKPAGQKGADDDKPNPLGKNPLGKNPHVFNPEHNTYECLNFDERGVYDHAASSGKTDGPPRQGKGWYGSVAGPPGTYHPRKKNAGLPDDDPSVMFRGLPLALAMRKKDELQGRFPGLSGAELIAKKRELDAADAREKKKEEEEKRVEQSRKAAVSRNGRNGTPASTTEDDLPKDPVGRMVALAPPRVIRKVRVKK